jgi:protein TonB
MRYQEGSRPLRISLGLSILAHLGIFLYLYSNPPLKKAESAPIAVEYLSPPKGEIKIAAPPAAVEKGPLIKRKGGRPGARMAKGAPSPKPEETRIPQVSPKEGKAAPEPHPLEVPKTPSYPGIKDLTPSLDQLTRMGSEREGEGGEDEETVSLDSTDFKYTSYLYGVKLKIEGVWRYPEAARKSALQGKGLVTFTIQRDGTLGDLKLLTSSGYPILDEAVLKAIRDASPFNPMTENMRVKRLNVVATFEYNLVVQRIWGR